MTLDQERETEAYSVWNRHGERAPAHVAERIGKLVLARDMAGVEHWVEIAAKLDTMIRSPRH